MIAAVLITTVLVSRNYIALPLRKLQRSADLIAWGELTTEIDAGSTDEIGLLARDLNTMRNAILHRNALLEDANLNLEQRVQERTDELAGAVAEIKLLNQRLAEDNQRMSAELDITRRIQEMLLPSSQELRRIEALDIAAHMEAASEVGGDYYDVLQEESAGYIKFGIGDVTGHGLESRIMAVMTQCVVRTLFTHGEPDPVRFLDTLNRVLYDNVMRMGSDKNLSLAVIDYEGGTVRISGQHESIFVVRSTGEVEEIDTVDLGFPIALDRAVAPFVAQAQIHLSAGDGFVLYTDGITEAENSAGEHYGLYRLREVLQRHWSNPAEDVKQAVLDDLARYIGERFVYDDITVVVVKQRWQARCPPGASSGSASLQIAGTDPYLGELLKQLHKSPVLVARPTPRFAGKVGLGRRRARKQRDGHVSRQLRGEGHVLNQGVQPLARDVALLRDRTLRRHLLHHRVKRSARTAADRDDLSQDVDRQTRLDPKHQRLHRRNVVRGDGQIVHELDRGTGSDRPDVENLTPERFQHRPRLRQGLCLPSDHDGERTCLALSNTSTHRGVKHLDAHALSLLGDIPNELGANSARIDIDVAWLRPRKGTIGAERDLLARLVRRQRNQHDIRRRSDLPGVVRPCGPTLHELFNRGIAQIVYRDLEPSVDDVSRYGFSHAAETNETYLHRLPLPWSMGVGSEARENSSRQGPCSHCHGASRPMSPELAPNVPCSADFPQAPFPNFVSQSPRNAVVAAWSTSRSGVRTTPNRAFASSSR